MPLFSVHDVHKSYPGENGEALNVLNGVSFSIEKGEIVAIVGQSGAGKSTLLHILGALDRPTSGIVEFDGEDIFKHSDEELALFRNRSIGFVFQFHHLLPEFSALENVMMPALIRNEAPEIAERRAIELLSQLGLKERMTHRPNQLSGGEQQRVAVARALTNNPALVLADEPTGNLDQKTSDTLHTEIVHLSREMGQTFVIVTHNPVLADLADRVFRIHDGNIHLEA